ncbi:competence CoiA-like predicted nuclease [Endozoicomonas sp. NE40]|uniref:Competence CoiA-like predicted nuclease n=1 Tax=Endozoicomonas lisbonensis TaxID=3120522 RepID=A0ABV2SFM6_9GAMM
MPLIARNIRTKERVNVFRFKDPKQELKKEDLECPFCHQPFFIRGGVGTSVRAHFAHYTDCSSD